MQIQVLQHVQFYYYKTWNYINDNGLEFMGKVAHKKDYHVLSTYCPKTTIQKNY